jgi:hypothetical protein
MPKITLTKSQTKCKDLASVAKGVKLDTPSEMNGVLSAIDGMMRATNLQAGHKLTFPDGGYRKPNN